MVFADQQPSAEVASYKHLDLSGSESVFVRRLSNKHAKNGGDSLRQLDMQLRTANEAIDYINATRIQRN